MDMKFKKIYVGVISSVLLIVPVWIVNGIIDVYYPVLMESKMKLYTSNIFLGLAYVFPIIFWLWKKNKYAFMGSVIGGILINLLCFYIALTISCSQGVCF